MARIKNGILGGFSGKVGSVVGYGIGDESYIRSIPKYPKKFTAKELVNQSKFKLVNDYLKSFRELLKVGFKNHYTKTGGLRAAVSYTMKNALLQQGDNFSIAPELIKISGGELPQALNVVVSLFSKDTLIISWENASRSNWYDQLILLAYDAKTADSISLIYDGPLRKEKQLELKLPLALQNTSLDIYIGFIAPDRSSQSNSQYLGRISMID